MGDYNKELYDKEMLFINECINNIKATNSLKIWTIYKKVGNMRSSFNKLYVSVKDTGSWMVNILANIQLLFLLIFPFDFLAFFGIIWGTFSSYLNVSMAKQVEIVTDVGILWDTTETIVETVVDPFAYGVSAISTILTICIIFWILVLIFKRYLLWAVRFEVKHIERLYRKVRA